MKATFALLIGLFSFGASANAVLVLKDTRQYDDFIAALSGAVDCPIPAAEVAKDVDCKVTRAGYVKGGELLTYSPNTGLCTRDVWQQLSRRALTYQGLDVSAPELTVQRDVYKCGPDGQRS